MSPREPQYPGAKPPVTTSLNVLRKAAASCTGCDLYLHATQTVFGEGPKEAVVMMVGEQPGDSEDRAGQPFIGPAGEILNRALDEAGIDRELVYVTNAVKHFAFEERGKRRIHRTPRYSEIAACRPWLESEIAAVRPEAIVCLGATAAKAVLGNKFRITQQHGVFLASPFAENTIATYHPSAVLRADTPESRHELFATIVSDLKRIPDRFAAARKRAA